MAPRPASYVGSSIPVRRLAVVAAALVSAVPAAANAAPSPTWRAPISVFTSPFGIAERSIAVGDRGQAIMVLGRLREGRCTVVALERPAWGRPWSPPRVVSHVPGPYETCGGQVLLNRRGDALFWALAADRSLITAARPHGRAWLPPRPVGVTYTNTTTELGATYTVGLADDGSARAVGVECDADGPCSTRMLVSARSGAPFREAGGEVGLPGVSDAPSVVVGRGGDALIVWPTAGATPEMRATWRTRTSSAWEAPRAISAPGRLVDRYPLAADVGERGDAVVARGPIEAAPSPGSGNLVEAAGLEVAVRRAGEDWATAEAVPGSDSTPVGFRGMSVDADGSILAAWVEAHPDGGSRVLTSLRSPSGVWEPPRVLKSVSGGENTYVMTLTDPPRLRNGRQMVFWSQHFGPGANETGMFFRDRFSSEWLPARYSDPTGYGPEGLDVAPDGSVIAYSPPDGPGSSGPARTDGWLQIQDFTSRKAPAAVELSGLRVTAASGRAVLRFALSGRARLVGSVWRDRHRVRTIATPLLRRGVNRRAIALPRGGYEIHLAVCDAAGCRDVESPLSVSVPR